jgi:hypothetical protein
LHRNTVTGYSFVCYANDQPSRLDANAYKKGIKVSDDEILRLNALGIQDLGNQYKPALADLQGAIDDLQQIQKDIRRITANIRNVAEVVSAIMKVLPILEGI